MKKTKLEKGITLIALIITIVVLLILAVVTIGAIQESKIIAHAKNASTGYNDEKSKEESAIAGYESLIDSKLPGGNGENQGGSDDGDNEEVTTPEEEPKEPEFVEYTLWTEGKSSNQTYAGATTGSSTDPIIPAGFMPKNTKTSKWDAADGPEVDKGLVIRDEAGNEFVWVPVAEDISTTEYISGPNYREPGVIINNNQYDAVASNLERAGLPKGSTAVDFKTELENIYEAMAESVNKYDGFYVGRFETSKNVNNPQSKASSDLSGTGEVITTVYNSPGTDWYDLYALNKRYKTSSVTGSMIWGIQYDKMMSWMGSAANTMISEYNQDRTCGTAPNDVIKNVYDLYGNSLEWTLEAERHLLSSFSWWLLLR